MKKIYPLFIFLIIILSSFSVNSISRKTEIEKDPIIDDFSSKEENRYALIIGTGVLSCTYSIYDAIDVKNSLNQNNWKQKNIKILTGISGINKATKENIIKNIENWLDNKENENDIVLIYFSGEGRYNLIAAADKKPFDEDPSEIEITGEELNSALEKLESNRIVLVFDSCNSGSFTKLSNELTKQGRVIISACKALELSFSNDDLRNGIFTYYFTCALNGIDGFGNIDKNSDGWVSISEAFSFAKPRTILKSPITQKQHPQIFNGCSEDIKITEIDEDKSLVKIDLKIFSKSTIAYLFSHLLI